MKLAYVLLLVCFAACVPSRVAQSSARGRFICSNYCTGCHNIKGRDWKLGPSLAKLFSRKQLLDGTAVSEPAVRRRIENGGIGMPAFGNILTRHDEDRLLEYLRRL